MLKVIENKMCFHRSIQDAAPYYRSVSGYEDEIVWASLWLFMATGEKIYIEKYAEVE